MKMKIKFIPHLILASITLASCTQEIKHKNIEVNYPETEKKPVVDTLFGTAVTDNYRWLEDDRSIETEAWVKAENAVTFNYLSKIPYKEQLKSRLMRVSSHRGVRLRAPWHLMGLRLNIQLLPKHHPRLGWGCPFGQSSSHPWQGQRQNTSQRAWDYPFLRSRITTSIDAISVPSGASGTGVAGL